MEPDSAARTIRELTDLNATSVQEALDEIDALAIPEGYFIADLEEFSDRPRRIDEKIEAHTLDGFLDYFEDFVTGSTVVFAHPIDATMVAVFDYHENTADAPDESLAGNLAGWGGHQLTFDPARSRELRAWMADNETLMDQFDFADFVEERAEDFTSPDSSEMLTIARNFNAKRNVDFKSAKAVGSGDIQLTYEEETSVTSDMTIPDKFNIAVPVFQGGGEYVFTARFRYRLNGPNLRLGYKLIRPQEIIEAAAENVLSDVHDSAEELDVPVYYGEVA